MESRAITWQVFCLFVFFRVRMTTANAGSTGDAEELDQGVVRAEAGTAAAVQERQTQGKLEDGRGVHGRPVDGRC